MSTVTTTTASPSPSAADPDEDFDLDVTVVDSGPLIPDLLRSTSDGCGSTDASACVTCVS